MARNIRLKTVSFKLKEIEKDNVKLQAKRIAGAELIKRRELFWIKALGICQACKLVTRFDDFELDHIIPLAQGGEDFEGNLQVLCKKCHSEKTKREGWG